MNEPVFRLEGIIRSRDEMGDFEGPLALILQLLSKNKIEIRDISISLILDQYLEYLEKMMALDLDIASEFVAMASHLVYIKTKMLLTGDAVEVTELEQLISSLEELRRGDIYLQIKSVTEAFSDMFSRGGAMLPGPPEYIPTDDEYIYSHETSDLVKALFQIINREETLVSGLNPRETVYPRKIIFSVPEKISQILGRLRLSGTVPIKTLFFECLSRTEIVATLIAVLELCKVGTVLLTGNEEDMTVSFSGSAGELPEEFEISAE